MLTLSLTHCRQACFAIAKHSPLAREWERAAQSETRSAVSQFGRPGFALLVLFILNFFAGGNASATPPVTLKSLQVLSDPINGTSNPFMIPGALIRWRIELIGQPASNPGTPPLFLDREDTDAVLLLSFRDNLPDDVALDFTLRDANNTQEAGDFDFLKVTVFSPARRGSDPTATCPAGCVTYYACPTGAATGACVGAGFVVTPSSNGNVGHTIQLNFNTLLGSLSTDVLTNPLSPLVQGQLVDGERVVIEFNTVIR